MKYIKDFSSIFEYEGSKYNVGDYVVFSDVYLKSTREQIPNFSNFCKIWKISGNYYCVIDANGIDNNTYNIYSSDKYGIERPMTNEEIEIFKTTQTQNKFNL